MWSWATLTPLSAFTGAAHLRGIVIQGLLKKGGLPSCAQRAMVRTAVPRCRQCVRMMLYQTLLLGSAVCLVCSDAWLERDGSLDKRDFAPFLCNNHVKSCIRSIICICVVRGTQKCDGTARLCSEVPSLSTPS